ncbi:hypothetical protein JHK87_001012 [Glycine soja]|nr:hypothetical protein JHK87_001012 [Glycine soja]
MPFVARYRQKKFHLPEHFHYVAPSFWAWKEARTPLGLGSVLSVTICAEHNSSCAKCDNSRSNGRDIFDLKVGAKSIAEDRNTWDDLQKKIDLAKQALFEPPFVPSTLVAPSVVIPPIGIMDCIVEIVVEVSSAHVVTISYV